MSMYLNIYVCVCVCVCVCLVGISIDSNLLLYFFANMLTF